MDKNTKEQFLKAYDAYSEAIYRHCYFRVFSRERAEELVQETFMRTWEYLAKGGKIRESIRPLLYRIATNLIIDDSRKKKETSLEARLEDNPGLEPAYGEDHEKRMLWNQLIEEINDLDNDERNILILRYVDDLDPKDIARILNIGANNVSVKINRAVKNLSAKVANKNS